MTFDLQGWLKQPWALHFYVQSLHGVNIYIPCCAKHEKHRTELNIERSHPVQTVYTWTCFQVSLALPTSAEQSAFLEGASHFNCYVFKQEQSQPATTHVHCTATCTLHSFIASPSKAQGTDCAWLTAECERVLMEMVISNLVTLLAHRHCK